MVGDNKILTVSYGTFSCTLEGFDDPFSSMKAIAEYFRDLAAEDRFFGAEPPQPDSDILHRIAEQTARQRIDSRVSDSGLVLRQMDETDPAMRVTAPLASPTAPEPEAAAETDQGVEPEIEGEPTEETEAEDNSSSIATATAAVAGTVAAASLASGGSSDVDPADALDDTARLTASEDSVAAKLQRIRSVVARESIEVSPYDEDEHAGELKTADANPSEEVEAQAETDQESDQENVPEIDLSGISFEEENGDDLDAEDFESEFFEDDAAEEHTDASEPEYEAPVAEEVKPRAPVSVERISREELIAAQAEESSEAQESEDPADGEEIDGSLSDEEEADLKRELEMLDADTDVEDDTVEEGSAEGAAEAVEETLPASENYSNFARSFLADTDDGDNSFDLLPSELGPEPDVKASTTEDAEVAEQAEDDDGDDTASENARAARLARREGLIEDEDAALERLMSATSSRLEDTESSVRRASIAHLKAAVAATKADSSLVKDAAAEEEAEKDAYRADLARVVDSAPKPESSETEAPSGPSPLVLVSGQSAQDAAKPEAAEKAHALETAVADASARSAEAAEGKASTSDADNIFAEGEMEPFAAYATRYDALELPDILEAAAGHYTHVEGVAQFTRPMLMRKISSISPDHSVSREDGLRSFGTLLREGKIVKGTDGKFVIASSSRFTEEARIAGE